MFLCFDIFTLSPTANLGSLSLLIVLWYVLYYSSNWSIYTFSSTEIIFHKFFLSGLCREWSKIFWKALVVLIPFLPFKGTTYAYLVKSLITHNKNCNCNCNYIYLLIPYLISTQNIVFKRGVNFRFSIF